MRFVVDETEGAGNEIVNHLEDTSGKLFDGKERNVGYITRLDEDKH